jgi:hypothetical protein
LSEKEKNLCVLMVGTAAKPEAAAEHVNMMSGCPYLASCCATGSVVLGAYVLPASKRWWIEGIAEQPELVGLEKARLVFSDFAEVSSPWSLGKGYSDRSSTPCGSSCDRCQMFGKRCCGCPSVFSGAASEHWG